jgi:hypothetical protein
MHPAVCISIFKIQENITNAFIHKGIIAIVIIGWDKVVYSGDTILSV